MISSVSICEIGGPFYNDEDQCCECEHGHVFAMSASEINNNIISIAAEVLKEREAYGILNGAEKRRINSEILKMTLAEDRYHAYDIVNSTDFYYSVPAEHCPVCQSHINSTLFKEDTALEYLMRKYNISQSELIEEMYDQFKIYENIEIYLNREEDLAHKIKGVVSNA